MSSVHTMLTRFNFTISQLILELRASLQVERQRFAAMQARQIPIAKIMQGRITLHISSCFYFFLPSS